MNTCVITGATSGIGLSIVQILVKKKYKVYVIGRNKNKWQKLKKNISSLKKIKFISVDISKNNFLPILKKKFRNIKKIDLLINNAGIINSKLELNDIKIEKTFFTNFLSQFKIINLFIPKLYKSKNNPLVINTSSFVSKFAKLNLNELETKINYNGWNAYKNSKLYSVILTNFYSRKYKNKIVFLSWSPGYTSSNLGRDSSLFRKIIFYIRFFFGLNPKKSAYDLFFTIENYNKFIFSGKFIYKQKICFTNFFKKLKKQEKLLYEKVKKNVY